MVGEGPRVGIDQLERAMNTMPTGCTPLTAHVNHVRDHVQARADSLRAEGKMIVVVLATDGLPSDTRGHTTQAANMEFRTALSQLQGLPVNVVVRLCTDDDSIVNYWNELDEQVE